MKEYISELEETQRKLSKEESRTLHYKRMYEQAQKDYLNTLKISISIRVKFAYTLIITTISILGNIYFILIG